MKIFDEDILKIIKLNYSDKNISESDDSEWSWNFLRNSKPDPNTKLNGLFKDPAFINTINNFLNTYNCQKLSKVFIHKEKNK